MGSAGEEDVRQAAASPFVCKGTDYSLFRTTVALAVWVGAIHFNVVLVLLSLLLLPARAGILFVFLVFALQLFFMVIPVNDKSHWGRKLSRFICKYAVGYFPLTLHVEDIHDFDPNQAYGR
ncbi:Diacylglycerol O-acyltransferase 2 [Platanthera zijinensis]|uniref:Diacylglycerol O-acyltransferase 2 n=1 Tax=Platanthera zijinensis TaxID=2320716 RepID=A0AAP0B3Q8_9ASPA